MFAVCCRECFLGLIGGREATEARVEARPVVEEEVVVVEVLEEEEDVEVLEEEEEDEVLVRSSFPLLVRALPLVPLLEALATPLPCLDLVLPPEPSSSDGSE